MDDIVYAFFMCLNACLYSVYVNVEEKREREYYAIQGNRDKSTWYNVICRICSSTTVPFFFQTRLLNNLAWTATVSLIWILFKVRGLDICQNLKTSFPGTRSQEPKLLWLLLPTYRPTYLIISGTMKNYFIICLLLLFLW